MHEKSCAYSFLKCHQALIVKEGGSFFIDFGRNSKQQKLQLGLGNGAFIELKMNCIKELRVLEPVVTDMRLSVADVIIILESAVQCLTPGGLASANRRPVFPSLTNQRLGIGDSGLCVLSLTRGFPLQTSYF